jgi:signal peptidase I
MQEIKRRKPIAAALMSAVLPGFGQLYNGEVNRGIWLFIAFALLNVPWLAVLALYFPGRWLVPVLLLTFLASVCIWIFGIVDAWRHAAARQDYVPGRWQTSGLYALVFIVLNLVALPALTIHIRENYFEPFRIPAASMEPSVLRGDFLVADKRYNCPGCKHRIEPGDVAIMAMPNDRTRLFIKRVIALPGDRVTIEGRTVSVNGRPLSAGAADAGAAEFIERSLNGREWVVQWGSAGALGPRIDLTVPPGEVFVLGDNRGNSRDSRQQGTVPLEDVIGRARQIWFSYGPEGVRWRRLGQLVR